MTQQDMVEHMLVHKVVAFRALIEQRLEEMGLDLICIDIDALVMAIPTTPMFEAMHADVKDAEAVIKSHEILDDTIYGTVNAIRRLRS